MLLVNLSGGPGSGKSTTAAYVFAELKMAGWKAELVGEEAKDLVYMNLPTSGNIRLVPGDHGDWDIFVQSTSSNRILLPGTSVLYWVNQK